MNRQGGSILLLVIGALLLAAPLVIQEVRVGENRRLLQERNDQVVLRAGAPLGEGAPSLADSQPPRTDYRVQGAGAPRAVEPDALPLPADEVETTREVASPAQGAGFRIQMPTLGLDWAVMADIGNAELAAGPGHYPGTAGPGAGSNLAIAGHRTHRGEPSYFYAINRLRPGDRVIIKGAGGSWVYQVDRLFITSAYDRSVLDPTPESVLTLTTCDPPGTEDKRLIVRARLVSRA